MLKVFVRQKFTGWLLKRVMKVQWRKGMWGNSVGCSKKAGLMRMRGMKWDPVFGHVWFETKSECKNSRKLAIRNFRITRKFGGGSYSLRSGQETKDVQGLAATFLEDGIETLVPRQINTSVYMVIMWRIVWCKYQDAAIKIFFYKNL